MLFAMIGGSGRSDVDDKSDHVTRAVSWLSHVEAETHSLQEWAEVIGHGGCMGGNKSGRCSEQAKKSAHSVGTDFRRATCGDVANRCTVAAGV